jgi:hypothetical protein
MQQGFLVSGSKYIFEPEISFLKIDSTENKGECSEKRDVRVLSATSIICEFRLYPGVCVKQTVSVRTSNKLPPIL